MNFTVAEILDAVSEGYEIINNASQDAVISNAKTLEEADARSLSWISPKKSEKSDLIRITKATVIVCHYSLSAVAKNVPDKCFILVENPRLTFSKILKRLFNKKIEYKIEPSAYIHNEAEISANVYIGASTHIGRARIGENTIIYGNCYVYDDVRIGNNVVVHAGTVIGADGFGYIRSESGDVEKFPHVGGVIIEDEVEIGANTCIDRGTLGNTIIRENSKIDNLVHIAHNVEVGRNSFIIANSMIGGSVVIGENSWIAPSVSIREGLKIGSNTMLGLGAVVTKNVPDNETWVGNPAKPLAEFIELQKRLKNIE